MVNKPCTSYRRKSESLRTLRPRRVWGSRFCPIHLGRCRRIFSRRWNTSVRSLGTSVWVLRWMFLGLLLSGENGQRCMVSKGDSYFVEFLKLIPFGNSRTFGYMESPRWIRFELVGGECLRCIASQWAYVNHPIAKLYESSSASWFNHACRVKLRKKSYLLIGISRSAM